MITQLGRVCKAVRAAMCGGGSKGFDVRVLMVTLIVVCSLLLGGQLASAQTSVHVVQPGETLNLIALRVYGNAGLWPTIYEANRVLIGADPNLILPGAQLVIPQLIYQSHGVEGGVAAGSSSTQYYTVQPGDTLQSIAVRHYGYGASWLPIYEANRVVIANVDSLRIGEVLALPAVGRQAVQQVQAVQQGALTEEVAAAYNVLPGQYIGYYTLVPGDTLVRISERFYGTWVYWPTIYEINRGALGPNPNSPPVGAVIALPALRANPLNVQQQIAQQVPRVFVAIAPVVRPAFVPAPAPQQPQPQPLLVEPGRQIALPIRTFGIDGPQAGGTHTVQAGETLVTIAQAAYGNGNAWSRIYKANIELIGANPANVPVGTALSIPN